MEIALDRNKLSIILLAVLIIGNISIILDVIIYRQILGLFILFLLGFLIVKILKIDKTNALETFVYSVGISIAVSLFIGLCLNTIFLILKFSKPLDTIPILISIDILFIILVIINYIKNINLHFSHFNLNLNRIDMYFLIIALFFPFLSIIGCYYLNNYDNNIFLIFLYFSIILYIIVVVLFNQRINSQIYPLIIFIISVSIVILLPLRITNIYGNDITLEYYYFLTTAQNHQWINLNLSVLDSCLSISLFPTLYFYLLNIEHKTLFIFIYPLITSIIPSMCYFLFSKYIKNIYAFLLSFYCSSQIFLFYAEMNPRTGLAVFFSTLIFITIFNDSINEFNKKILMILFFISLLVSHYSTTYLVFFILSATWFFMIFVKRFFSTSSFINWKFLVLSFTTIFLWFGLITASSFKAGLTFLINSIIDINNIFIFESRDLANQAILGGTAITIDNPDLIIPYRINFIFNWIPIIVILFGFFVVIIKYKEFIFTNGKLKLNPVLKRNFEPEFFLLIFLSVIILICVIIIPAISIAYDITRTFIVVFCIVSFLLSIGANLIANYLKLNQAIILLILIIPFFLSTSGVTYAIFGHPQSTILGSEGIEFGKLYIFDSELTSSRWLISFKQSEKNMIFTDSQGYGRLRLTGQLNYAIFDKLNPSSIGTNNYIYIRKDNINKNIIYDRNFFIQDRIYNNGNSMILRIKDTIVSI